VQGLYALRDPLSREVRGDDEASHATPLEGFFYGPGKLIVAHAMDVCLVLSRALGEASDDLLAFRAVFLAVFAFDGYVFGTLPLRHVAGGAPNTPQDGLSRRRH
jgi:hypothetical protein